MSDSHGDVEWFANTYRRFAENIKDINDWQYLRNAAIYRKHCGDLDGAIEAMLKAIDIARALPDLAEQTATMLNYLAADLYLPKSAIEAAEQAIRQAVELSQPCFPGLLANNLWILANIHSQKGEYSAALASAEEARRLHKQQLHSHGVALAEALIREIEGKLEH
jgi:tetratricopeptide (TPR) repeat protein